MAYLIYLFFYYLYNILWKKKSRNFQYYFTAKYLIHSFFSSATFMFLLSNLMVMSIRLISITSNLRSLLANLNSCSSSKLKTLKLQSHWEGNLRWKDLSNGLQLSKILCLRDSEPNLAKTNNYLLNCSKLAIDSLDNILIEINIGGMEE